MALFPFVCCFCFFRAFFISRSYENHSMSFVIFIGFVVVVVFYTRVGIDKVEGM